MFKFKALLQVGLIVLGVAIWLGILILGLAGCGGASTPSQMAPPREPTETAVPTVEATAPAPTQAILSPSPTPADMSIEWLYVGAPAYGLSWRAPRHWQDIEEQWPTPTPGAVLLDASANDKAAAWLFSSSYPAFPNGLMVLTVHAVTVESPLPNLQEAQPVTISQQSGWLSSESAAAYVAVERPGWVWEVSGVRAAPFTWRATLFIQGLSAYSYTLSFGCALPSRTDTTGQADFEVSCRRIWEEIVAGVEVVEKKACLPPPTPTAGPITWRRISDAWYKYSFEIPSGWHEDRGPTADRLVFFSDLALVEPFYCPSPDGLMKLDFGADPPLKYGRDLEPDLTGMSPITVAGRPAWIFSGEGGEAAPSTFVVSAYIAGPEYWYYLWLGCTPSEGDAEVRDRLIAECRSIMDHILGSFQITP